MPKNLREHPKAVQYFLREAQAVARLNHRNIVTVFDVDQEENIFFITMELLKGHPLNTVLKKKGNVPFEEGDVAHHHRHTAPPDPRTLVEGIPDDRAELILELMQKTPEARPADAHVVRQRLERILRAGR